MVHSSLMHIATKSGKIDISLEVDTAKLARKFSKLLNKGDIVFLYGEIGVGKTTFVRYLINNIQKINKINLSEVTSPTFNLINEYQIKGFNIEHYDLFRLKDAKEIENIGLFANYENVLTLVEWPEKIKKKPKDIIELKFYYDENLKKRSLIIKETNKK
mgnify:CR=1 FL=1